MFIIGSFSFDDAVHLFDTAVDWGEVKKVDLIEQIARLFAQSEGVDPDAPHMVLVSQGPKRDIVEVDSERKKYQIYMTKAQYIVEMYKVLKKELP